MVPRHLKHQTVKSGDMTKANVTKKLLKSTTENET